MITKTILPDSITLPCGAVLYPVIGGHIKQEPFLTMEGSGVDVRSNGWLAGLPGHYPENESRAIIAEAKKRKLKYRRVSVLSRNLRGKFDLHHRPYTGSQWVFVEVKP